MPNESKLGLLAGVAMVLVLAIAFSRQNSVQPVRAANPSVTEPVALPPSPAILPADPYLRTPSNSEPLPRP